MSLVISLHDVLIPVDTIVSIEAVVLGDPVAMLPTQKPYKVVYSHIQDNGAPSCTTAIWILEEEDVISIVGVMRRRDVIAAQVAIPIPKADAVLDGGTNEETPAI